MQRCNNSGEPLAKWKDNQNCFQLYSIFSSLNNKIKKIQLDIYLMDPDKIPINAARNCAFIGVSIQSTPIGVTPLQNSNHLNRNMIPSTGAPWRTMVESKKTFSRLKLMAICFLYLGSQLSNMAWLSTKRLRSSKSLDWNSWRDRLYRSRFTITKSVFSSAMIVAFRIQSVLIRASSPKLLPASVIKKNNSSEN